MTCVKDANRLRRDNGTTYKEVPMETLLRMPVKEVIGRYPAAGSILDAFGIGCVPCSVGTCQLNDILEIHALTPEDETALLARIAAIVSPGRVIESPTTRAGRRRSSAPGGYSPAVKRLVDEHVLIMRFVALVPDLIGRLDIESAPGRRTILDGVDFIRTFADRCHHAKEEEILFSFFDPDLEILKAMLEDHRRGRACVKEVLDALERGDRDGAVSGLAGYATILGDHIRKEDGILYPWMDRVLSTHQVGEIFARFDEADERFAGVRAKAEAFVVTLEDQFSPRGAEVSQ